MLHSKRAHLPTANQTLLAELQAESERQSGHTRLHHIHLIEPFKRSEECHVLLRRVPPHAHRLCHTQELLRTASHRERDIPVTPDQVPRR